MKLFTPTLTAYDVGHFKTFAGSGGKMYAYATLYSEGAIYPLDLVWTDCVLRFENTEFTGVEVRIRGVDIRTEPNAYKPGANVSLSEYDVVFAWGEQA